MKGADTFQWQISFAAHKNAEISFDMITARAGDDSGCSLLCGVDQCSTAEQLWPKHKGSQHRRCSSQSAWALDIFLLGERLPHPETDSFKSRARVHKIVPLVNHFLGVLLP